MAQAEIVNSQGGDTDPAETAEWLESLRYVLETKGPDRVRYLLSALDDTAYRHGVEMPFSVNTPYINTIPADRQPVYPGNREIERRIKSIIRWNAMAMVVRANKRPSGHRRAYFDIRLGRHAVRSRRSTISSAAAPPATRSISRGTPRRAFTPGPFSKGGSSEQQLEKFRQELPPGGGLSSYPHPWLMPNFWQFPTVSMGLGPIMAIYQARFNHYLMDRGIKDTEQLARVGLSGRRRMRRARNAWARSRWPRARSWTI